MRILKNDFPPHKQDLSPLAQRHAWIGWKGTNCANSPLFSLKSCCWTTEHLKKSCRVWDNHVERRHWSFSARFLVSSTHFALALEFALHPQVLALFLTTGSFLRYIHMLETRRRACFETFCFHKQAQCEWKERAATVPWAQSELWNLEHIIVN